MIPNELIDNLPEWEKKCKEGILCEDCKGQKNIFPPGGKMKIEKEGIRGGTKEKRKFCPFWEQAEACLIKAKTHTHDNEKL